MRCTYTCRTNLFADFEDVVDVEDVEVPVVDAVLVKRLVGGRRIIRPKRSVGHKPEQRGVDEDEETVSWGQSAGRDSVLPETVYYLRQYIT